MNGALITGAVYVQEKHLTSTKAFIDKNENQKQYKKGKNDEENFMVIYCSVSVSNKTRRFCSVI